MKRSILLFLASAFLGFLLIAYGKPLAKGKPNPNSALSGSYAFHATGTALVTPANASTFSPSPDEPTPLLLTAALGGVLVFDGNGNITGDSQVWLDIAGTSCPPSAYQPVNGGTTSGTYTVSAQGPGTLAVAGSVGSAIGTLSLVPGGFNTGGPGTGPFCSQTTLNPVNFILTGIVPQHRIAISFFAATGKDQNSAPNGSTVGSAALPSSVTPGALTSPATQAAIPNPVFDFSAQGEGVLVR